MRKLGETRFGVFDRNLIESALACPQHAAKYENADIICQAATFLTNLFLKRNGWRLKTNVPEIVEMVLAVESDKWRVDEIEKWLHSCVAKT